MDSLIRVYMSKNKTDKTKKTTPETSVNDKLQTFAHLIVERLLQDQQQGKLVVSNSKDFK
jgi:hypothetical protein